VLSFRQLSKKAQDSHGISKMMIAPMAQAKVIMSDGPAVLTLCHFYTAAPNAALRQSKVGGNSRLRPFGSGGSPRARILNAIPRPPSLVVDRGRLGHCRWALGPLELAPQQPRKLGVLLHRAGLVGDKLFRTTLFPADRHIQEGEKPVLG